MEGDASSNNTTHTRNASFSSYISRAEGNFMLKLSGSVQIQNPPPAMTLSRKSEEGEISVFGAERYFNMMLEDDGPRIVQYSTSKLGHNKKENRAGQLSREANVRPATPSSCSEASWNSQSALLPSRLENPSQSRKKKINVGHRERQEKDAKQPPPRFQAKDELLYSNYERSNKEEHFASTNLNSGAQNFVAKSQLEDRKAKKEEAPRKSLEVFGSNTMQGDMVAINLERKLPMLSWDAIPKAQSLSNTSGTGAMICEDVESDASSDLFEIENLPGSGQMISNASQFESSETTMESRAVTAEVSDCDEKKVENCMHKVLPK